MEPEGAFHRIEVEPAPSKLLDEAGALSTVTFSADADALLARYAARFQRFEQELKGGARLQGRDEGPPGHLVELPGRSVRVIYDEVLNRRLLLIYAMHGWAGVQQVGVALHRIPVAAYPWIAVRSFFAYTRNMLALLIRNALVDIEQMANAAAVVQLNQSTILVNEAWRKLDVRIRYEVTYGETPQIQDEPSTDPMGHTTPIYLAQNRALSAELYTVITAAVEERESAEAYAHEQLREAILEDMAVGGEEDYPGGLAELGERLATEDAWLAEHNEKVEQCYTAVHTLMPLAILAVPLLHVGFTQDTMEYYLTRSLAEFFGEGERLATAFNRRVGWVDQAVPGLTQDTDLEKLYPMDAWIEGDLVATALTRSADDHGYLSMLSEPTLRRLVDGPVAKDSFQWIVLSQYIVALMEVVEAERRRAEIVETIAQGLLKLNAALNLAMAFAPAAPEAAVARLISRVLGVGLLIYQGWSVVHQLAQLDRQLAVRLVELDALKAADIARLTELAMIRKEMVDEITQMVVKELAVIAASQVWPQFKTLAHWRGYYFDLEILTS
jgi:hypothetical protein